MDGECFQIKERVTKLEIHREADKDLLNDIHDDYHGMGKRLTSIDKKIDALRWGVTTKLISGLLIIIFALIGVNYNALHEDHVKTYEQVEG